MERIDSKSTSGSIIRDCCMNVSLKVNKLMSAIPEAEDDLLRRELASDPNASPFNRFRLELCQNDL
jgi:hypothetical protein